MFLIVLLQAFQDAFLHIVLRDTAEILLDVFYLALFCLTAVMPHRFLSCFVLFLEPKERWSARVVTKVYSMTAMTRWYRKRFYRASDLKGTPISAAKFACCLCELGSDT